MASTRIRSLPYPAADERWSLFLDFDGTLAEIVPRPEDVQVDPELPGILRALEVALGGALALISGRPIALLDRVIGVRGLPAAGLHGLEMRREAGAAPVRVAPPGSLDAPRRALGRLTREDPRLLLEDKDLTLALHFRRAPERAQDCEAAMLEQVTGLASYELIRGKMVIELKPAAANKGLAAAALMQAAPFQGRRPVFVGDDETDEDGFEYVQKEGGVAVKVGPGASRARFRAADVPTVIEWLDALSRRGGGRHA